MENPSDFTLAVVSDADAISLFRLVNTAYIVESGNDGVAFKNCERYVNIAEVHELLRESVVIKAVDKTSGTLLGMIAYQITPGGSCYFGPFAVAPEAQGRGIGRSLRNHVEKVGRQAGCTHLEITVVNVRDDILPMYRKDGFVEVGTGPFPDPWKVTRPVHFLVMHKKL